MNIRMRMMLAVEREADAEQFYNAAKRFGERAARALGERKRSQITGLESIANSSQKVSDVFDYLKLHTARQKEWQHAKLGQELLEHLETVLRRAHQRVCAQPELTELDDRLRHEVYRLLIRAFVAHMAAEYEFACLQTRHGEHQ